MSQHTETLRSGKEYSDILAKTDVDSNVYIETVNHYGRDGLIRTEVREVRQGIVDGRLIINLPVGVAHESH